MSPLGRTPFSSGSQGPKRSPRTGNCACGGKAEDFWYIRAKGKLSGQWYCKDCTMPVLPNVGEGTISPEEMQRLERWKALYSDAVWGAWFAHEPVIACAIPRGEPYEVVIQ